MSSVETMPGTGANVLLRRTFRVGIVLKGLHSLLETVLGIALFVVSRRAINSLVWQIGRLDLLSRDPHDLIGSHLRQFGAELAGGGRRFAAIYLLSHGLVKLVLVVELLRNRLWAYPLMLVMLGVFVGYQTYRYTTTHSIAMVILTVFDLAVMALTWMEYQDQLRLRTAH